MSLFSAKDPIYKYVLGVAKDMSPKTFFNGFSGHDPDAPKRAPGNLDPKKRMLGVTPMVVFMEMINKMFAADVTPV